MKFDVSRIMKDLSGNDLAEKDDEPLTLKTVCGSALLSVIDGEKIDGSEKHKRYKLAAKFFKSNDIAVLTPEEITLVRKLIGNIYAPLVSGQAWDMLEEPIVETEGE